jgi:hypothetical protein
MRFQRSLSGLLTSTRVEVVEAIELADCLSLLYLERLPAPAHFSIL